MGTATRRLRSESRLVMHWCRSMTLVYSSDNGRPAKRPGPNCGASESGMRAGIEDKRFLKKTGKRKRKRKGAWWGLPPAEAGPHIALPAIAGGTAGITVSHAPLAQIRQEFLGGKKNRYPFVSITRKASVLCLMRSQ